MLINQNGIDDFGDLTMGVKIKSGLIDDNAPHIVLRSGLLAPIISGAATLVTMIGSLIGGLLYYRSRGRDQRYLDLAPGTLPTEGQTARTGPSAKIEIPVRFTPPDISVGEAGLLIDGQFQHRDTAATMVDLAVRGAIRLEGRDEHVQVVLLDRSLAHAPHEKALLDGMFGHKSAKGRKKLGKRGSLTQADKRAADAARAQVRRHNWFRTVPERISESSTLDNLKWGLLGGGFLILMLGMLVAKAVASGAVGQIIVALIVPLVPVLIVAWILIHRIGRHGVRTADGRAICDQVEGFRTYLATAEAGQLQFEEGKDVFSAYLPWAIAFDLTDRWTKVCARLVELGRIPEVTPNWYAGDFRISAFDAGFITASVVNSATPVETRGAGSGSGSSGSGFGGGSSFSSGGGFSGGGGGGGGGGSW